MVELFELFKAALNAVKVADTHNAAETPPPPSSHCTHSQTLFSFLPPLHDLGGHELKCQELSPNCTQQHPCDSPFPILLLQLMCHTTP